MAGRLSDFTAAANELGLTQAAASQRIRKLEATLGTHSFDWRDGDSIWATVSKKKINAVNALIKKRDQSGTLTTHIQKRDARRKHIGQLYFLYGRRIEGSKFSGCYIRRPQS